MNRNAVVFSCTILKFHSFSIDTNTMTLSHYDNTFQVVNQTCVEIRSVAPAQVCIGSTENITISGRGFTNKLVQGQSACRFKTGDGQFYCKGMCVVSKGWSYQYVQ